MYNSIISYVDVNGLGKTTTNSKKIIVTLTQL